MQNRNARGRPNANSLRFGVQGRSRSDTAGRPRASVTWRRRPRRGVRAGRRLPDRKWTSRDALTGNTDMRLVLLALLLPRCRPASGDSAVLEHEVTALQAAQQIRSVGPQEGKAPGCAECSYWERFYCISHEVLDDHCCCDQRYQEWFPYVPHQCYLEEEMCTTHAANCEEYMRIRTCCCDLHTVLRWKYLLSGKERLTSSNWMLLLVLLLLAVLQAPS
ncbi:uncharacterized protein LOC134534566 [Bacillus rossius redtenbacheri]|uniref:uncharacterized protein LOC134534566 n=1 Tax=Bacillus rossius redtenbacheri TaxID=93214 RepID=UPI002FDEED8A